MNHDSIALQRQMDEVFMSSPEVTLGIDIQALMSVAASIKRNAERLNETHIRNILEADADLIAALLIANEKALRS